MISRDDFIQRIALAILHGHLKLGGTMSPAQAISHAITVANKLPALFEDSPNARNASTR
jgi:hypothetical protein